MKGGLGSVLVFSDWGWKTGSDGKKRWYPHTVKPVVVDGEVVKADTCYTLQNGEVVEAEEEVHNE